jgi:hypothetical protein
MIATPTILPARFWWTNKALPSETGGPETDDEPCCSKCGDDYEEQVLLPFLPEHLAEEIRRQHRVLNQSKHTPDAVLTHWAFEDNVFRQYLPGHLWRIVKAKHDRGRRAIRPG